MVLCIATPVSLRASLIQNSSSVLQTRRLLETARVDDRISKLPTGTALTAINPNNDNCRFLLPWASAVCGCYRRQRQRGQTTLSRSQVSHALAQKNLNTQQIVSLVCTLNTRTSAISESRARTCYIKAHTYVRFMPRCRLPFPLPCDCILWVCLLPCRPLLPLVI